MPTTLQLPHRCPAGNEVPGCYRGGDVVRNPGPPTTPLDLPADAVVSVNAGVWQCVAGECTSLAPGYVEATASA